MLRQSWQRTFSRRGRIDDMLLRLAYLTADAIIVHSRADEERLRRLGHRAYVSPLVQMVPQPSDAEREKWRQEWCADGNETVVLFGKSVV